MKSMHTGTVHAYIVTCLLYLQVYIALSRHIIFPGLY